MRLPEDDADTLKYVGVFTIYKNTVNMYVVHLLIWIIKNYMGNTS